MGALSTNDWKKGVINNAEIDKYLVDGKDYIDDQSILSDLVRNSHPDPLFIRDILQKSLSIKTLTPGETAALLQVESPELWEEINQTALEVKKKVYDNRIVFFAPLYCANYCVNNCAYCGFREANNLGSETDSYYGRGKTGDLVCFTGRPQEVDTGLWRASFHGCGLHGRLYQDGLFRQRCVLPNPDSQPISAGSTSMPPRWRWLSSKSSDS